MPRDLQVSTPENVPVSYDLAGLGSRCVAVMLDTLIQDVMVLAIVLCGILVVHYTGPSFYELPGKWMAALAGILGFAIFWGYYFYFEGFKDGQTPGKRVQGLRVVRDGGLPIDPTAAAIRNLVRIIDILPGFYVVGVFCMFISPTCKRLGDYAAGTIVVKERVVEAPPIPSAESAAQPSTSEPATPEGRLIRDVVRITSEEYQAIKRYCERRSELQPAVREQLAQRIAAPLLEKLEIDAAALPDFRYQVFLGELLRRCQSERGFL